MAEDNLPRRSRKVRQRLGKVHRHLEENKRRLNEISAGHEERWREIREKSHTVAETQDVQMLQMFREDVAAARDEELDQVRANQADQELLFEEVEALSEEFEAIAAEVSVEGSKLRTETLKQQATLAAGAIVGVGAITSVIMPSILHAEVLLWATYVVLLETVVFSVLLMHIEAERVENVLLSGSSSFPGPFLKWSFKAMHIASMSGLPVAVWLFLIFQLFNMSW